VLLATAPRLLGIADHPHGDRATTCSEDGWTCQAAPHRWFFFSGMMATPGIAIVGVGCRLAQRRAPQTAEDFWRLAARRRRPPIITAAQWDRGLGQRRTALAASLGRIDASIAVFGISQREAGGDWSVSTVAAEVAWGNARRTPGSRRSHGRLATGGSSASGNARLRAPAARVRPRKQVDVTSVNRTTRSARSAAALVHAT